MSEEFVLTVDRTDDLLWDVSIRDKQGFGVHRRGTLFYAFIDVMTFVNRHFTDEKEETVECLGRPPVNERPTTGWPLVDGTARFLLPLRWLLHQSGVHLPRAVGKPARISINGRVL